MARIRTVKPEFWSDEKIGPLRPIDRLVFLGLISMADDAGRVLDTGKIIDAFIFPFTDDSAKESLAILDASARIRRGISENGQSIIQIINWHHQKIDKPNTKAMLPEIAEASPTDRRQVGDVSALHISTTTIIPTTNDLSAPKSGAAAKADGKVTWLTPYFDLWAATAGTPPNGQLVRYLRPVHDEIGQARTTEALGRFLRSGGAQYGPAIFARDWRKWDAEDEGLSATERRSKDALEGWMEEVAADDPR